MAAQRIRAAGVMALVRYGARPGSVCPLCPLYSLLYKPSLLRPSSTPPRGKRARLRNQSTSSTHSSRLVVAHHHRQPISADELTSPSLSPRLRLSWSSNHLPRSPQLQARPECGAGRHRHLLPDPSLLQHQMNMLPDSENPSLHLLSACGWLAVGRAVICSPGELSTKSYVRRAAQAKGLLRKAWWNHLVTTL